MSGPDLQVIKAIQIINLNGRIAALIADDEAIISEHVTGSDRVHVQAKAHFALRILVGELPAPYTDEAADRYARSIATQRPPTVDLASDSTAARAACRRVLTRSIAGDLGRERSVRARRAGSAASPRSPA